MLVQLELIFEVDDKFAWIRGASAILGGDE
jgi:hypothetical protein